MPDISEVKSIVEASVKRLGELRVSLDLAGKSSRVAEIDELMGASDFWNDKDSAQALVEERNNIKSVIDPVVEVEQSANDSLELLDMAVEMGDDSGVEAVTEDILALPEKIERLETMALLSGPHDNEPCFFSIHTGAGGSDACEWAEMLMRMYTRFFERQGWKFEEMSFSPGDEAGIKGVELRVSGQYAYGYLKGELGVHRLVRISPFSGRRETSFAAVDVVPDYQESIDIEVDENDLKIDRIHATGKGGQHVNKTASAVRLTHEPSGIVVMVQTERSQHRNKDLAMKILKSRLYQKALAERAAAENSRNAAKVENAWGSQIRNYVLHPYQMVKDHRTNVETGNIQAVLDGDLD
ncbi:MAG: peptide chain release factor 2, partial [Planctomycetes bacterium]|nr:peptide chain release factor 2 [Planctomycetota bacterium]